MKKQWSLTDKHGIVRERERKKKKKEACGHVIYYQRRERNIGHQLNIEQRCYTRANPFIAPLNLIHSPSRKI